LRRNPVKHAAKNEFSQDSFRMTFTLGYIFQSNNVIVPGNITFRPCETPNTRKTSGSSDALQSNVFVRLGVQERNNFKHKQNL
ncbi:hypothetical protein DCC62_17365, partial [candidate division KSB1 bacterium]